MLMKSYRYAALAVAVLALSACGGGGGGGETPSTPSTPPAPVPTVTVALSNEKAHVGTSVTVNWSATNATTCTGSDGLNGALQTSGTQTLTPSAGGQYKYTVTCTGAGGSATQTTTLTVPIPVLPNSYLNAKAQDWKPQVFPRFQATAEYSEAVTGGVAFGDFKQNGKQSMIVATNRFAKDASKSYAGRIAFYEFSTNGEPVEMVGALDNSEGCISPRKVIVADLNNDKIPDAFVSCHGAEIGQNITWTGESPRVILSQPGGKYKNVKLDMICYCHAAAAADLDGDGNIDILTSDVLTDIRQTSNNTIVMLKNDGAGNFNVARNWAGVDVTVFGTKTVPLWTIELHDVDSDNKPELITTAFIPNTNLAKVWAVKSTNGQFNQVLMQSQISNYASFFGLDLIVRNDNIYVYGGKHLTTGAGYEFVTVHRVNLANASSSEIFNSGGVDYGNVGNKDVTWVMPVGNMINAYNKAYNFSVNF